MTFGSRKPLYTHCRSRRFLLALVILVSLLDLSVAMNSDISDSVQNDPKPYLEARVLGGNNCFQEPTEKRRRQGETRHKRRQEFQNENSFSKKPKAEVEDIKVFSWNSRRRKVVAINNITRTIKQKLGNTKYQWWYITLPRTQVLNKCTI